MRKAALYLSTFILACVVGITITANIVGSGNHWSKYSTFGYLFGYDDHRSCQVKQVGADGHATWTQCGVWKQTH